MFPLLSSRYLIGTVHWYLKKLQLELITVLCHAATYPTRISCMYLSHHILISLELMLTFINTKVYLHGFLYGIFFTSLLLPKSKKTKIITKSSFQNVLSFP